MRLVAAAKIAWAIAMFLIGLQACRLLDDVIRELAYIEELVKGVRTNTSELSNRH
jgi:hypothetical protein